MHRTAEVNSVWGHTSTRSWALMAFCDTNPHLLSFCICTLHS